MKDKIKYKNIFTLHLIQFYKNVNLYLLSFYFIFFFHKKWKKKFFVFLVSIKIFVSAPFSSFILVVLFIHQLCVFFYCHVLYLKSSNFKIFGNEQICSESEEPKRKSIGITYSESKPF